MKKLIIILSFAVPLISLAQDPKKFNPQAALSVVGGMQYNKNGEASAPVYGFEFSMECPLEQGKNNHIRQKLSVVRGEGKKYTSLSAEINPQYKIIGTSSFELGIGPAGGVVFARISKTTKSVFIYGVGAGAVYYFKRTFIGVESRYGMTKKIPFDKIIDEVEFVETSNLNNFRTFLKLGIKF